MIYLSAEQVLFIHSRVIQETGGSSGLRDLGLLLSAVARPQTTFEGQELYPELEDKAAALLESLTCNHAFVDGNKRTAFAAVGLFLRANGRRLKSSQEEVIAFMLRVARRECALDEIRQWISSHCENNEQERKS